MKRYIIVLCFLLGAGLPAGANALTAQEIVLLKQNGVSEATVQMMLESERAANAASADEKPAGIRTIHRPDGRRAIVYSTGSGRHEARQAEERLKEERAWEMLRQIIVDTRGQDTAQESVPTE